MQILGIETSCDETAVAIVSDKQPRIRANLAHVSVITHVEPATEEELAVTESDPGIWKGVKR